MTDFDATLIDDANEELVMPERVLRGDAFPRARTAHTQLSREREYLMPLYGAYHGRKLESVVSAPFVKLGWLTRGGRRDWLTEDGRAALRKCGFDV